MSLYFHNVKILQSNQCLYFITLISKYYCYTAIQYYRNRKNTTTFKVQIQRTFKNNYTDRILLLKLKFIFSMFNLHIFQEQQPS